MLAFCLPMNEVTVLLSKFRCLSNLRSVEQTSFALKSTYVDFKASSLANEITEG